MASDRLLKFTKKDKDFLNNIYPFLAEREKESLWMSHLTFDFRDNPYHNPLDKFSPEKYSEWKLIEPNFDQILDKILDDIEMIDPWYEGCGWDDTVEEINKRLGRE